MSDKTISIGFTNEEYENILKLAQAESISISQNIKTNN